MINPHNDTAVVNFLGQSGMSGNGKYQGAVLAQNGKIYGIPLIAQTVLIIDKNSGVPAPPLRICLSPHINKL